LIEYKNNAIDTHNTQELIEYTIGTFNQNPALRHGQQKTSTLVMRLVYYLIHSLNQRGLKVDK